MQSSTAGSVHKIQNETVVSRKTLISAIITGQIAGLIMAVVVMLVFAIFLGKSPLYPVQVIGSMVFGQAALEGLHIGAILAGLILHQLGPSLLWGVLFGIAATKFSIETTKKSLIAGLILGVIAMSGPYVLIPFLMTTLHGVDFWNQQVPMFWDWAAHIVFGLSFVLFPKIKEKI
ncbi:hypothetical protein EZJ49_04140 [Bdellovibrio bacteriovorus]|uniref:hypothetical protein n=1 Tax=Bdellovibrio bacteriovorus TaxID=959 RepID=UPI0021CEA468|nr:hypothetical protein [Bdellovibrio bacteriovorus]UXR65441.1 hypothetical protein EZJ49_04140 [Bdellovibrio bacteriovorus]